MAESGRKREKLRNIVQYFAIEKMQRGGSQKNAGWEPGLKGTGSGRFKPPCPPPPHQGQLVKTKQKTHTQEKQNNNKYSPGREESEKAMAENNDNQFVSPLNVFSTLITGHTYLLRALIGSFNYLHPVIGLVLVYDT